MNPEFYVVGIDDPYNREPLEPTIPNSSGSKLLEMSGLSLEDYRLAFKRRNLFSSTRHPRRVNDLRIAAKKLCEEFDSSKITNVIALGVDVATGFGWCATEALTWSDSIVKNVRVVLVPHPSGLNRRYNLEENKVAATEFVEGVALVAKDWVLRDFAE